MTRPIYSIEWLLWNISRDLEQMYNIIDTNEHDMNLLDCEGILADLELLLSQKREKIKKKVEEKFDYET